MVDSVDETTSVSSHTIRLRGPWTCRPAGGQPIRYQAPHELEDVLQELCAFGDAPCRVVLERKFNRPSGLNEATDVHLSITSSVCGRVVINGHACPLLSDGQQKLSILSQLEPRKHPANRTDMGVESTRRSSPRRLPVDLLGLDYRSKATPSGSSIVKPFGAMTCGAQNGNVGDLETRRVSFEVAFFE